MVLSTATLRLYSSMSRMLPCGGQFVRCCEARRRSAYARDRPLWYEEPRSGQPEQSPLCKLIRVKRAWDIRTELMTVMNVLRTVQEPLMDRVYKTRK